MRDCNCEPEDLEVSGWPTPVAGESRAARHARYTRTGRPRRTLDLTATPRAGLRFIRDAIASLATEQGARKQRPGSHFE
eukprot:5480461-Pyramimonas_sp.AAC.1